MIEADYDKSQDDNSKTYHSRTAEITEKYRSKKEQSDKEYHDFVEMHKRNYRLGAHENMIAYKRNEENIERDYYSEIKDTASHDISAVVKRREEKRKTDTSTNNYQYNQADEKISNKMKTSIQSALYAHNLREVELEKIRDASHRENRKKYENRTAHIEAVRKNALEDRQKNYPDITSSQSQQLNQAKVSHPHVTEQKTALQRTKPQITHRSVENYMENLSSQEVVIQDQVTTSKNIKEIKKEVTKTYALAETHFKRYKKAYAIAEKYYKKYQSNPYSPQALNYHYQYERYTAASEKYFAAYNELDAAGDKVEKEHLGRENAKNFPDGKNSAEYIRFPT